MNLVKLTQVPELSGLKRKYYVKPETTTEQRGWFSISSNLDAGTSISYYNFESLGICTFGSEKENALENILHNWKDILIFSISCGFNYSNGQISISYGGIGCDNLYDLLENETISQSQLEEIESILMSLENEVEGYPQSSEQFNFSDENIASNGYVEELNNYLIHCVCYSEGHRSEALGYFEPTDAFITILENIGIGESWLMLEPEIYIDLDEEQGSNEEPGSNDRPTVASTYSDIASAIRERANIQDRMTPLEFAEKIAEIPEAELSSKSITSNGTYLATSDNVDGYDSVSVNVQPNLQSKSLNITTNTTNTITPASGYDGLSSVTVTTNVQPKLQSKNISITSNETKTYNPSSTYQGFSSVTITTNVPTGSGGLSFYDDSSSMRNKLSNSTAKTNLNKLYNIDNSNIKIGCVNSVYEFDLYGNYDQYKRGNSLSQLSSLTLENTLYGSSEKARLSVEVTIKNYDSTKVYHLKLKAPMKNYPKNFTTYFDGYLYKEIEYKTFDIPSNIDTISNTYNLNNITVELDSFDKPEEVVSKYFELDYINPSNSNGTLFKIRYGLDNPYVNLDNYRSYCSDKFMIAINEDNVSYVPNLNRYVNTWPNYESGDDTEYLVFLDTTRRRYCKGCYSLRDLCKLMFVCSDTSPYGSPFPQVYFDESVYSEEPMIYELNIHDRFNSLKNQYCWSYYFDDESFDVHKMLFVNAEQLEAVSEELGLSTSISDYGEDDDTYTVLETIATRHLTELTEAEFYNLPAEEEIEIPE